jgi:hypothetical protein
MTGLKRLAAAAQLRPWPPSFQAFSFPITPQTQKILKPRETLTPSEKLKTQETLNPVVS